MNEIIEKEDIENMIYEVNYIHVEPVLKIQVRNVL